MSNYPQRRQYSSCDWCRRSRLSCDAHRRLQDHRQDVACTRCQRRNQRCTFEWLNDSRGTLQLRKPASRRSRAKSPMQQETSHGPSVPDMSIITAYDNYWSIVEQNAIRTSRPSPCQSRLSSIHSTSPASPASTQADSCQVTMLRTIFHQGFNTVFGSWMGHHGCPLLSLPNAGPEEAIDIPALCIELDAWISHSDRDVDTGQAAARRMVAGYMDRSIQAFSARWLSILIPEGGDENQDTVVQQLWRRARRDMLQAINKPSYSSMLSLFIFALTPIPTGISESEELDGISGQVCIHAALQHIQMLRARQRNLQFSGSKVFPCSQDTLADSPPMSPPTTEYITAESKAFWAALTFDTSASLTLNCRSLLSAGLFGFEEESSWRLVRAGSKIFYETVKEWTANKHMKITDDMANEIISTSTAWKLLTWKLVAVFKEALRDGHDESEINSTFVKIVSSIKEFDTVYRPPLLSCKDRMPFLSERVRFRWYSMMLHYHLCILLLVDILEASHYFSLLEEIQDAAGVAENAVMNTLEFGLRNLYTIQVDIGDYPSVVRGKAVPILAFDPYPHHVVACVRLIGKAIERDLQAGKLSPPAYQSVHETLRQVLEQLPGTSKSVQAARSSHNQ